MDLFGEDASSLASTHESCCDVCSQSKEVSVTDRVKELEVLIDAIDVGDKGEVKLAQWIRGSSQEWTIQYNKDCHSFSNSMGHSEAWWRTFMRQCYVEGVVEKELKSIIKKSGIIASKEYSMCCPKVGTLCNNELPFYCLHLLQWSPNTALLLLLTLAGKAKHHRPKFLQAEKVKERMELEL